MTHDQGSETASALRPVSAIVVAYGSVSLLDRCLDAFATGADEILVVDNSRDADVEAVASRRQARYLDPGGNVGFAAAVNLGIRAAREDTDILLVNPDAELSARAIGALSRVLHSQDKLAAVAPSLFDSDGHPQRVEWPFPSPAGAWLQALGLSRLDRSPTFVVGAVLLLRREALEMVGGFDERFFLYAEEADWQYRAHRAGWRSIVAEEIAASHIGAASSSDPMRRSELFQRSQGLFARKWYGRTGFVVMWSAWTVGSAIRAVIHRDKARRQEARRLTRVLLGQRPRPAGEQRVRASASRSDGAA